MGSSRSIQIIGRVCGLVFWIYYEKGEPHHEKHVQVGFKQTEVGIYDITNGEALKPKQLVNTLSNAHKKLALKVIRRFKPWLVEYWDDVISHKERHSMKITKDQIDNSSLFLVLGKTTLVFTIITKKLEASKLIKVTNNEDNTNVVIDIESSLISTYYPCELNEEEQRIAKKVVKVHKRKFLEDWEKITKGKKDFSTLCFKDESSCYTHQYNQSK